MAVRVSDNSRGKSAEGRTVRSARQARAGSLLALLALAVVTAACRETRAPTERRTLPRSREHDLAALAWGAESRRRVPVPDVLYWEAEAPARTSYPKKNPFSP